MMRSKILWALLAAWLAGSAYMLHQWSGAKTDLELTRRELKEVQHAIVKSAQERVALQAELKTAAAAYVKELQGNKDAASALVAQHSTDNKRLRVKLANSAAQCSGTGSGGHPTDDRAELHRETSEALIGITMDADSHIKALQATVRVLQGGAND